MTRPKTVPARTPLSATSAIAMLVAISGCASKKDPSVQESPQQGAAVPAAAPASLDTYAIVDGQRTDTPDIPMGDPATIEAILNEGMHNNRVMDHLTYITENFGARLTASSSLERANMWTADRFREWGLSNVQQAQWGEANLRFDRGPSSAQALRPQGEDDARITRDFEFTTLAWTRGTDGPVRGRIVKMPESLADLDAVRDHLAGAWIMLAPDPDGRQGIRGVTAQMNARRRLRDQVHEEIASGPVSLSDAHVEILSEIGGHYAGTIAGPGINEGEDAFVLDLTITPAGRPRLEAGIEALTTAPVYDLALDGPDLSFKTDAPQGTLEYMLQPQPDGSLAGVTTMGDYTYTLELARAEELDESRFDSWEDWKILRTILEAGPAGFISSSRDERVWTSSIKRGDELLKLTLDDVSPEIEVLVRESDYDHVNSKLADGVELHAEIALDHTLTPGAVPLYNTIAEIPGTEMPEEVVIVSAHLDSWNGPGSTGTCDNATGSSVTIEAARILASVGARPKRTIRFILWTGEEQGLMGSRAYVDQLSEQERARISAVFVDDGGTNSQGGIPAADFMVDYLAAATSPTNGHFTSPEHAQWALTDDADWNDDGDINVNIRPTGDKIQTHGGSDHAPFNAVGIPGFFWDEVGRASYWDAWHTQNDTIDQAIPEYLAQSATNAAITAYNLACAPDLLPRTGPTRQNVEQDPDAIETQIGTRQ